MCCLLCVVCSEMLVACFFVFDAFCSLFAISRLLLVGYWFVFVVCCWLVIGLCLLFDVRCLLFVACRLTFVAVCLPFVVCCLLFVVASFDDCRLLVVGWWWLVRVCL